MASPCRPLSLFEGINFMDPIVLDEGDGGYRRGGDSCKS